MGMAEQESVEYANFSGGNAVLPGRFCLSNRIGNVVLITKVVRSSRFLPLIPLI